jgi:hypothetical protein
MSAPVNPPASKHANRWDGIERPYSQVNRGTGRLFVGRSMCRSGRVGRGAAREKATIHPGQRVRSALDPLDPLVPLIHLIFSLSLSSQEDVDKLRGSVLIKHTLAERGAEKLWELCSEEPFVPALGALTGGQAVQSVRAGLKAIYCSGKEKEGGRAWGLALSLHLRPLNRNHLSQLA